MLLPVRGPVRHQVGVVGWVKTWARSSSSGSTGSTGAAVSEQVERRVGNVDDPLAVRTVDPGPTYGPFARYGPVEDRRARRRLDDLERELSPEDARVSRTPSPVRLRGSGKSSRISSTSSSPTAASSGTVSQSIGIVAERKLGLRVVGKDASTDPRLRCGSAP